MKKGWIFCGAAVLLIGGAAAAFGLAEDSRTRTIRKWIDLRKTASNPEIAPQEPERTWLDMNGDGEITTGDLYRAKLAALKPGGTETMYAQPDLFAKQLGRTAFHEDTGTLWCSLSGSGIDFTAYGSTCVLTLAADSAYSLGEAGAARYAVYVNGELKEDAQLLSEEQTVTLDIEPGANIRLVKLSESAQSSLGIRSIRVDADRATYKAYPAGLVVPTAKKERLIEFIGDSITCGYGVDGEYGVDTFQTANENAEKAYAIRTAEKLDADYSLVSYSGHGIVSGYTTQGKLNGSQLVPKFYGQVGHSSAVIEERHKMQDDKWDFHEQPDLVVINLGTNDASYTGGDAALQKEFAAAYTEFLKTVREKNPDAPILCTLGIMGQTLCNAIDLAVKDYTAETGDTNINTMWFDVQDQNDGLAVDWHPSAKTHEKAAEKLSAFIRDWLGW